ncbi:hypothetical protein CPC08DRAFT_345408 [Agrocybe pediades]|nr:hypothetical protein CPC08DRAFT_345408 [Agrocybe pediades]
MRKLAGALIIAEYPAPCPASQLSIGETRRRCMRVHRIPNEGCVSALRIQTKLNHHACLCCCCSRPPSPCCCHRPPS